MNELHRFPGFSAEASLTSTGSARPFKARTSRSANLGARVVAADDPGHCECSSILGIGCSNSADHCNEGYVPACNCGLFGNSCQCVSGT